ncbi:DUF1488 family protein [Rivibacter subsaxonicus]|uniref:Uncharacterized protein DUF1488 n=1 Tax=Rivibacter subsaxonicus TaxID=457575 RepID=A0A4Q7VP17_9BURK|nr:DUF1488 family protein [Rivibacter subsaxonicus]RZT97917.1 uncharacterized protein DUF1488 [Rivibacter subsaxonicus]
MPTMPFFHEPTAAVRFWVAIDGVEIGASISGDTLHYRYRRGAEREDPLQTYRAHADEIDAAVRRRVAQGSIEPVMVREFDLRASG